MPIAGGAPLNLNPALCTSFLPADTQGGIVTKYFPDRNLTISVRTLCVDKDIPVMYHWMSQEYAGYLVERDGPPEELKESYSCMLKSMHAQPYMGLVNDIPVCQLDIYKVQQDAISLSYPARPGDYGLNMLMAPLVIHGNVLLLLKLWLEYFFSFDEVERIIVDVEAENEWLKNLFSHAGFHNSGLMKLAYKDADLYVCTRESFAAIL